MQVASRLGTKESDKISKGACKVFRGQDRCWVFTGSRGSRPLGYLNTKAKESCDFKARAAAKSRESKTNAIEFYKQLVVQMLPTSAADIKWGSWLVNIVRAKVSNETGTGARSSALIACNLASMRHVTIIKPCAKKWTISNFGPWHSIFGILILRFFFFFF